MENALEKWDALKFAIDEAHSVIDLTRIRNQAEAYLDALGLEYEGLQATTVSSYRDLGID